jgi:hypothetical protein
MVELRGCRNQATAVHEEALGVGDAKDYKVKDIKIGLSVVRLLYIQITITIP